MRAEEPTAPPDTAGQAKRRTGTESGNHLDCLLRCHRADRIGHRPAGSDEFEAGHQQPPLEMGQACNFRGCDPMPDLGPPSQSAQATAWSVYQNTIEAGASQGGKSPIGQDPGCSRHSLPRYPEPPVMTIERHDVARWAYLIEQMKGLASRRGSHVHNHMTRIRCDGKAYCYRRRILARVLTDLARLHLEGAGYPGHRATHHWRCPGRLADHHWGVLQ